MRRAILAVFLCSVFVTGCSQYIMKVRLFDTNRKPVMDAGIAVRGKYVSGYSERGGRGQPVLKEFHAMRKYSYGEMGFGVWGMPDSFQVSADAPGFEKLVGSVTRSMEDGLLEYRVKDVNAPYSFSNVLVTVKGSKNIFIDVFLQSSSSRGWR
jgi:hypothetical protein